jgi:hypothetical protein
MFCNGDLDKARLWGKLPPLMCRPDPKRAAVAIAGDLNPQSSLNKFFMFPGVRQFSSLLLVEMAT